MTGARRGGPRWGGPAAGAAGGPPVAWPAMGILDKILRAGEGKKVKALAGLVPDINAFEPEMKALSDDALQAKTPEFRQRLDNGEDLDDLLLEAFAVTREAAQRVIGQRHYDVQLMGGAALHFGWVAEMKTGEGKTLVSTLPAYLNGLSGQGVHIITVNDYLARRDAEWMGQIHRWLGLDVGLVIPGWPDQPTQKRAMYAADITYGTNNEFGFDYLRDNMATSLGRQGPAGPRLRDRRRGRLDPHRRGPHAADHLRPRRRRRQALLPVRLHRPQPASATTTTRSTRRSAPSRPPRRASRRSSGPSALENLYDEVQQNLVHQLSAALKAKELYKRDKDYIIQAGEVKIVDEFTGRILEGRRWCEGIHQAVEAKEGVKIKEENQTLATITLQNYFRMYDKLAGMTGTAPTEAAELMNTYGLQVVPDPHEPADGAGRPGRQDLQDRGRQVRRRGGRPGRALREGPARARRHDLGREVASTCRSQLRKRGVAHEVLNAKQHTREAASSPRPAGSARSPSPRTWPVAASTSCSAATPRAWPARRSCGRASRPRALVDELDLPVPLEELPEEYRKLRVEAWARYDELLEKFDADCKAEGDKVRELGGLYVLGTERHDSRRIDNQLRGRSGRQGDPGESRFYLSLDDELMRLFATGAMSWVMGKALPDDVPIEAKMVTKAIERAQNTVEQRNGEIRKNVLKYDEVMNEQRKVIYKRRDQILAGADLRPTAMDDLAEAVDATIERLLRGRRRGRVGPRRPAAELQLSGRRRSPSSSSRRACEPTRSTSWPWARPPRTTSAARKSSAPSASARSSAR